MMDPNDPRHGTYAGASQHWKHQESMCDLCTVAASRRRKLNRVLRQRGRSQWVPVVGTVRRLRSLRRLGWTVEDIAREADIASKTLRNPSFRGQFVHRDTFNAVAFVYDRLCMTRPEGGYHERSRRYAARQGWPPPLAWDDIDDPNEDPVARMREDERWVRWWESRGYRDTDQSAVERVLGGDWRLPCSTADKRAVVARWRGSQLELEALTGWKVDRYVTHEVAA